MATPTKPTAHPDWTTGDSSQVEAPSPSQQASGFTANQRPTYQLLNWLFWLNGQWIEYFDSTVAGNAVYTVNNPLLRMVGGGAWSYNAATNVLSWSDAIYIAIPGTADAINTIPAGSVTLTPGQVAYVEVMTSGTQAQALTPQVAQSQALSPDLNTVLFARCVPHASYASEVMVGVNAGQMMVRDGEVKYLLEAGYDAVERVPAGQALTANQAVYVSSGTSGTRTPGSVYPADASSSASVGRARVLGFVSTAVAAGSEAHVIRSGVVNGFSGLTPGAQYFLDPANPGALTTTAPTAVGLAVVPVGVALSATALRFNPAAADMAATIPNGLTVTGPLAVNGQTALKPGQSGTTLAAYDAAGKNVVASVDATGNATFAGNVGAVGATVSGKLTVGSEVDVPTIAGTGGTAQAPTLTCQSNLILPDGNGNSVRAPYITATGTLTAASANVTSALKTAAGIKRSVSMGGYASSSFPGGNQNLATTFSGSDYPRRAPMAYSGSIIAIAVSFAQAMNAATNVLLLKNENNLISANLTLASGGLCAYINLPKGQYTFAAGDVLRGTINFSQSGINVISQCDITIESDA